MSEAPDIMTGELEYFSTLFWTQPHTWDTPEEPERDPEDDENHPKGPGDDEW